ncbi:putative neuronal acetylcholine receptor subunit alpha-7-like [Ditylenchus destructor]|uniref:Neuronal acetylcholine receptor subunit alpha-7-like n=1 Tax=Ditylenchus destructor TaxID=166010 RepID=A0AAD4MNV3_9BILA|nr:putative neuronal acetylcholine receptor subunit alpha-7-like [Ditylenchus destructor]
MLDPGKDLMAGIEIGRRLDQKVSRSKGVEIGRCRDQKVSRSKVSRSKGVEIGRCRDRKVSRSKGVEIKRCRDQKVSRSEGVEIKRCRDRKVSRSKGVEIKRATTSPNKAKHNKGASSLSAVKWLSTFPALWQLASDVPEGIEYSPMISNIRAITSPKTKHGREMSLRSAQQRSILFFVRSEMALNVHKDNHCGRLLLTFQKE